VNAAVIVANPLGAQITAISAELVERSSLLCAQADTTQILDLDSLAKAEALFVAVDGFTKQLSQDRLALTRQIDALKKSIMAAEEQATAPLLTRRVTLAKAIAAYRDKLEAERREKERLAREEAERKAAELRRQQEAERKAALEKWEAEQAAARAAAEEEAKLFGTTPAQVNVPPPPAPEAPAPVLAVIDPPSLGAQPGKSPVRTQTRKRTVITDRDLLLAEACKGCGKLHGRLVLLVDEKAVDDLLRAGVPVPGAKTETYQVVGAAGSR
jgi:chemotaxis protein histidine kinase CheA